MKYLLKLVEKHFHMVKYFRISFVFNIYDSYLRSERFVTMDRGKHTNYMRQLIWLPKLCVLQVQTMVLLTEDPVLINTLRNSGTWELCDIPEQENTEVVTITAYYPEDEELQPRLTQIDEDLTNLETRIGKCRFGNTRFRTVSEQDWANEWKQYFHVTHIGRTLVIKPLENIHLKLVNILLKSIQGWRLVQEHIIRPVCVWNVWKSSAY